jgi:hypothetical protein
MNWLLMIGSIAGVLGLAWAARLLGLGGGGIEDEAHARRLAEESQLAFTADRVFLAADRRYALVRGLDARWVVLKLHGAQVAARALPSPLAVTRTNEGVTVATGERMFGDVTLHLTDEARDKLLTIV